MGREQPLLTRSDVSSKQEPGDRTRGTTSDGGRGRAGGSSAWSRLRTRSVSSDVSNGEERVSLVFTADPWGGLLALAIRLLTFFNAPWLAWFCLMPNKGENCLHGTPGSDAEQLEIFARCFTFRDDTSQQPGRQTIPLEACHHPQGEVAVR
ncbi:hypothetical protein HJG60_011394 [Phyllostomus discolor]|uniref:Uncharacterized protein n=1 Tax=Phyllostomus discolor TaxID=89673 RepID=A0A834A4N5_9CHIR|nr:hypothetical protein HJG60_011394 [Phyllostomus discolor]